MLLVSSWLGVKGCFVDICWALLYVPLCVSTHSVNACFPSACQVSDMSSVLRGKWRVIQSLSLSSWCLKSSGRVGAKQSPPLCAATTMASAGTRALHLAWGQPRRQLWRGLLELGWESEQRFQSRSHLRVEDGMGKRMEGQADEAWFVSFSAFSADSQLPRLLGHLTLCSWEWLGFWPCSGWLDSSLSRTMTPGPGDPCTIFLESVSNCVVSG